MASPIVRNVTPRVEPAWTGRQILLRLQKPFGVPRDQATRFVGMLPEPLVVHGHEKLTAMGRTEEEAFSARRSGLHLRPNLK